MEAFEGAICVNRSAPDTDASSSDESFALMEKAGISSKNRLFDKNHTNLTISQIKRQNEFSSSVECRKKGKYSSVKDEPDYLESELSSEEVKQSQSTSRRINSISSLKISGKTPKRQLTQLKPEEAINRVISHQYILNVILTQIPDKLSRTVPIKHILDVLSCKVCNRIIRIPMHNVECGHECNYYLGCLECLLKSSSSTENTICPICKKQGKFIKNDLLESIIHKLSLPSNLYSKRLKLALRLLNYKSKIQSNYFKSGQKTLINRDNIVFRILYSDNSGRAYEKTFQAPNIISIKDIHDLSYKAFNKSGRLVCNGMNMEDDYILGFVYLYIWRQADVLTLNLQE